MKKNATPAATGEASKHDRTVTRPSRQVDSTTGGPLLSNIRGALSMKIISDPYVDYILHDLENIINLFIIMRTKYPAPENPLLQTLLAVTLNTCCDLKKNMLIHYEKEDKQ